MELTGLIREDDRQVGGVEMQVTAMSLFQKAEEYPITPKEHGVDFLMNHRHLWLRSRRQWAILRIRNRVIMSIHEFFQERGFLWLHSPIITLSDAEGAGEMFRVSTLDAKAPPRTPEGEVDFSQEKSISFSYMLKAAQFYEYKMGHTPDKCNESFFGYNSVLPGAYSVFRWEAIQGRPLMEFFKGLRHEE